MKIAPLITAALVLCMTLPGDIDAKNKPKPKPSSKYCKGKDGNRYQIGQEYLDAEACIRYTCTRGRNRATMKKEKVSQPCTDISSAEAEDQTEGQSLAVHTGTFERQILADLDINETRKRGKKPGKGKKPSKPAKCSCAALKTKMESLEKGVDSILEKITALQCTSTPPSDRKPVLVIGPIPWITVSLEDFSLIPSSSTVPDPGLEFPFEDMGQYAVGKVIKGKMYVCDTYKKWCISYDGSGLEWKLENEMVPLVHRPAPSDDLTSGDQPRWIIQGGSGVFDKQVEIWTPESGRWKKDPNYMSPDPNDIGCIVDIEGKILQVGGRLYDDGYIWTNRVFLGDVEVASLKSERIYHDCTMFENRVWVAGGVVYSPGAPGTVEIYDYKDDTWTYGPSLPFETNDAGKLSVIQGELYYICRSCETVFKLVNNTGDYDWKAVANIPKILFCQIAEAMEINQ